MKLSSFRIEGLPGYGREQPLDVTGVDQVTTLVGPNGAGKSTILRVLHVILSFLNQGTVCETIITLGRDPWLKFTKATLKFARQSDRKLPRLGQYAQDTARTVVVVIRSAPPNLVIESVTCDDNTIAIPTQSLTPATSIEQARAQIDELKKRSSTPPGTPNAPAPQQIDQINKQMEAQNATLAKMLELKVATPSPNDATVDRTTFDSFMKALAFPRSVHISDKTPIDGAVQGLIDKAITLLNGPKSDKWKYGQLRSRLQEVLQADVDFTQRESKRALTVNGYDHSLLSTGTVITLQFFSLTEMADPNSIVLWDEPENSLHPTRRCRLVDLMLRDDRQFLVATHAGEFVPLTRDKVQIVRCEGEFVAEQTRIQLSTYPVENRRDAFMIAERLGLNPATTLFTANVVVWVEGPTERLFLRHWLPKRLEEKKIYEGFHYTLMQYGGGLISHLDACDEADAVAAFDLLSICRYPVVLVDSDLTEDPRNHDITNLLKPGAKRLARQINLLNEHRPNAALFLCTWGREIENYLPPKSLAYAVRKLYRYDENELAAFKLETSPFPRFIHYYDFIEDELITAGIVAYDNAQDENGDHTKAKAKAKGRGVWGEKKKVNFMRTALTCPDLSERDLQGDAIDLLDQIAAHIERHANLGADHPF